MKFAEKAKRMVRAGTLLFMFILTFGMITTYADGFSTLRVMTMEKRTGDLYIPQFMVS